MIKGWKQKDMKECDKRKTHNIFIFSTSSNVRHAVTKNFTLLHYTSPNYTSLHFTKLVYTSLPPI